MATKQKRKKPPAAKPHPAKHSAPKRLPTARGGGVSSWTAGDGAPPETVERLRQQFDADRKRLEGDASDVLDLAAMYWLTYPLFLEQVGYWWAQDEPRHAAYNALTAVHHRAAEILMQAAERAGIASGALMESAQWCRQLLAEPETYRPTGETWPNCLEASRDALPSGAWEAAQRGYATLERLSVKLKTKPPAVMAMPAQRPPADNVKWSLPNGPKQWAKRLGLGSSRTFVRLVNCGKIPVVKESDRSYRVAESYLAANSVDHK